MSESGPLDRLANAVGDAAAALRRRRLGREPHVRLHEGGSTRTLPPGSLEARRMLDIAADLLDAASPRSSSEPGDDEREDARGEGDRS